LVITHVNGTCLFDNQLLLDLDVRDLLGDLHYGFYSDFLRFVKWFFLDDDGTCKIRKVILRGSIIKLN
jgi:hypothetical protein